MDASERAKATKGGMRGGESQNAVQYLAREEREVLEQALVDLDEVAPHAGDEGVRAAIRARHFAQPCVLLHPMPALCSPHTPHAAISITTPP